MKPGTVTAPLQIGYIIIQYVIGVLLKNADAPGTTSLSGPFSKLNILSHARVSATVNNCGF
jgi:hypothetical protein